MLSECRRRSIVASRVAFVAAIERPRAQCPQWTAGGVRRLAGGRAPGRPAHGARQVPRQAAARDAAPAGARALAAGAPAPAPSREAPLAEAQAGAPLARGGAPHAGRPPPSPPPPRPRGLAVARSQTKQSRRPAFDSCALRRCKLTLFRKERELFPISKQSLDRNGTIVQSQYLVKIRLQYSTSELSSVSLIFLILFQKRDENDVDVNANVEVADDGGPVVDASVKNKSGSDTSKVAKTRSQQKMQVVRNDTEKIVAVAAPVKKTVTFGSVESCGDTFKYSKRVPPKCHRPLVSIIKKKSAFKTAEHTFHNIVKPAKLTDLGTKTCLDFSTLRAHHNRSPPVKKSALKFSLPEDDQNSSRSNSTAPIVPPDKDGNRKFVLSSHSAHSSRAIKPNKRFIDPDEAPVPLNSSQATKVLKKPKLILNNQSDGNVCYDEAYETCDSSANSNDSSDSKGVENGSNLNQSQAKPASYFDKSINLFGSNPNKSLSTSFQDTFVNGLKNSIKVSALDESESIKSESAEVSDQASNEQLNGGISRRLLQPSRHISETPCTSDQSSSSTASESSESDEASGTSDSEESDLDDKGSVEKIQTQSQLVSGKVVLREARLQLNVNNNSVSINNGNDGPFSTFGNPCATSNSFILILCVSKANKILQMHYHFQLLIRVR